MNFLDEINLIKKELSEITQGVVQLSKENAELKQMLQSMSEQNLNLAKNDRQEYTKPSSAYGAT